MNKKGIDIETMKKAFLEAMLKTFGNVSMSAKAAGISRSQPYAWAKKDTEFKEAFESDIYEEAYLDAIEAKLAKVGLQDENPTVLIFLAKTKGKRRGYVEKTETEISGEITIDFTND